MHSLHVIGRRYRNSQSPFNVRSAQFQQQTLSYKRAGWGSVPSEAAKGRGKASMQATSEESHQNQNAKAPLHSCKVFQNGSACRHMDCEGPLWNLRPHHQGGFRHHPGGRGWGRSSSNAAHAQFSPPSPGQEARGKQSERESECCG